GALHSPTRGLSRNHGLGEWRRLDGKVAQLGLRAHSNSPLLGEGLAQLLERDRLELADALAAQAELLADLAEGDLLAAASEAEAASHDVLLARREPVEHPNRRPLPLLGCDVLVHHRRVRVREHLVPRTIALLADERVQRDGA